MDAPECVKVPMKLVCICNKDTEWMDAEALVIVRDCGLAVARFRGLAVSR